MQTPFRPSPPVHLETGQYSGGEVFSWKDGMPKTKQGKSMAKEQAQQLFHAVAAAPYLGTWNPITSQFEVEEEFIGLTNMEVAAIRLGNLAASGDRKAMEMFFDRLLGKPKQAVESVSMHLSYSEVLDMLAQQDASEVEDESNVITITPTPISIFDDPDALLEGV